jgi:hypothetical protein
MPLRPHFPRLSIDAVNVVCSGVAGQIDGLGHRIVQVFQKSRLDTQVIFWSHVQRRLEEPPAGLGNLAHTRQRTLAVQRPDEVFRIKPIPLGHLHKNRVELCQGLAVERVPAIGEGKQRLDTGRGPGNEANGASRGDRRAGGVAHRTFLLGINTVLPVRKDTALVGQLGGRISGLLGDELHEVLGQ